MTEEGKMERGELFDPGADGEMRAARERCAALCHEYNRTAPWEAERRGELLRQLIGRLGEGAEFTPPFWCGYGYNISAGEGFYPNHNVWMGAGCTVLAGAEIGDNSVIAAGSVVKGKIPPNVVAAGVPCRVLRRLED